MKTSIIKAIIGFVISALIVFGSTTQAYAATDKPLADSSRQSLFSYIALKSDISVEQAVKIAYNHAGVDKQDVIFPSVEVQTEDGHKIYKVGFFVGMTEYCYVIDGESGRIIDNIVYAYNEDIN